MEIKDNGAISWDYFSARAESVLSNLAYVDPENIGFEAARLFSHMFADAKAGNAILKRDMAVGKRKKEYWTIEKERWQKALREAKQGDEALLSRELLSEANRYIRDRVRSGEAAKFGTVLTNLAKILN